MCIVRDNFIFSLTLTITFGGNNIMPPNAYLQAEYSITVECIKGLSFKIWMLKVKLSLCMPWKEHGGAQVCLHSFLTLALDEQKKSTSLPGRLTFGEKIKKQGGPWSQYRIFQKQKISFPCKEQNPPPYTPWPNHYTDWVILPAKIYMIKYIIEV
jgi:hypothetical protein